MCMSPWQATFELLATKMINSARFFLLTKYLVIVLVLVYFVFPYLRSHSPDYVRDRYPELLGTFQDEKKLFVAEFLKKEVGGDLDGSALAKTCESKTWFPASEGIILSCEPVPGGIGEVKNGQLNCIRLAIEIGAQVVLPRISQRSTADISNLHGGHDSKGLSLEHFFSLPHLTTALHTYCPQLTVHSSLDALWDQPSLLKPVLLNLNELTSAFLAATDGATSATTIIAEPARLRTQFLAYLAARLPDKPHYPVRVHLTNPAVPTWPTLNETFEGVREFGKLLRVREDVRALAASAVWNLVARYGGDMGRGFVGVHLRTEKDARDAGFPGFDDQAAYFFDYLRNHTSFSASSLAPKAEGDSSSSTDRAEKVIFLATGLTEKDDDVKRFRQRAATDLPDASVLLKRDLLDAAEIKVLNGLSWDQRALVDYEILLRAGTMLGIVESRFAWAVALRRAEAYGEEEGAAAAFRARPGGEEAFAAGTYEKAELAMWVDRWSRLFGRTESAVAVYLGTWP